MEALIDRIVYDDPYARYQFNQLVRGVVLCFIVMLFLFAFQQEWEDARPYTGDYNEYISIQGSTQKEQIETMQNEINLMPDWILDEFKADGGKVYLSSKNFEEVRAQVYGINETKSKSKTIGFFYSDSGKKEIWIYSYTDEIKTSTLHEFGHYFDNYCADASGTEVFKKCYEAERKQYENLDSFDYHVSTEREYFASCFLQYIKHNELLKKYCPQTYTYMDNLFKC